MKTFSPFLHNLHKISPVKFCSSRSLRQYDYLVGRSTVEKPAIRRVLRRRMLPTVYACACACAHALIRQETDLKSLFLDYDRIPYPTVSPDHILHFTHALLVPSHPILQSERVINKPSGPRRSPCRAECRRIVAKTSKL